MTRRHFGTFTEGDRDKSHKNSYIEVIEEMMDKLLCFLDTNLQAC